MPDCVPCLESEKSGYYGEDKILLFFNKNVLKHDKIITEIKLK